ncbi:PREDICTED: excitatory amino acid transporter 1-like [Nicrophorus vespilloides]|uniref:Amino acid transporter n=1 Tax=Nicrophorus vespilloides TaxID=110193 RepID=A0ABM1MZE0_NICVS|nr:PREDICTED: excitatory amino acid transporter 1-like [Nicrophorus vespilloides]
MQTSIEGLDGSEEKRSGGCLRCLRSNLLTLLTVAGVVLGAGLGFILKSVKEDWTEREIMYVNFVGDIFLRMLKALILPLIISSLISAIANLDLSLSGKIAARAIVYYMLTTVLAVILGIILVTTIRPGDNSDDTTSQNEDEVVVDPFTQKGTTADTLLDLVRSMFPPNLIEACTKQHRTLLTRSKSTPEDLPIELWKVGSESVDGMNILGLVVFSVIFGVTLAKIGEEGRPLANFFQSLMSAMMTITTWVIWLSPVGIFFLVASKILEMQDIVETMSQMGMYFVTVLVGILIHGFVFLPLIFFLFTKRNPLKYISNMGQAIATAFGTASSSASLPVTIQCLENNNGINKIVSRFVLPIGATINMDGTALYEAVAAIFIAQVKKVSLSVGQVVAISITATAASIGAAGIPQAGLVTMVMVLDTVGLTAKEVTLILAVDWLLDRFRTAINVLGDSFGAGIVDHLSQKELQNLHNKPKEAYDNKSLQPDEPI